MVQAPICRARRPAAGPQPRSAERQKDRARSHPARPSRPRCSGSRQRASRGTAFPFRSVAAASGSRGQAVRRRASTASQSRKPLPPKPRRASRRRQDRRSSRSARPTSSTPRHSRNRPPAPDWPPARRKPARRTPARCRKQQHRKDSQRTGQSAQRQRQQGQGANSFEKRGDAHDEAAAKAVGHGAGNQHQKQRWQELDNAHKTEIERIAGQVIDLPADSDGHDLRRECRQETGGPEAQECPVAKGGVALVGGGRIIGCHLSGCLLEHDPEKCVVVFGKDHAKLKKLEHGDNSKRNHRAPRRDCVVCP